MDPRQTRQLLIRASAIDRRLVTDVEVAMWQELLGHIDYLDLDDALREHLTTSPYPVQPAHLVAILDRRRTAAALKPVEAPECRIHAGYPTDARSGLCDQCMRHPEDLAPGAQQPVLVTIGTVELTVGRSAGEI